MQSMWEALKDFQSAFGFTISDKLTLESFTDDEEEKLLPSISTAAKVLHHLSNISTTSERALRVKLLCEEMSEYLDAEYDNNIIEIADGLTDIHYIAAGTEAVYGIPGEELFNHIHTNNMSKLGKDGKPIKREDGKLMKPEGYQPPDVRAVLNKFNGGKL